MKVRLALILVLAPLPAVQAQQAAWRTTDIPEYKVYSDVPDTVVLPMLRTLQRVQADFELIWPAPPLRTSPPVLVVFCLRPDEFKAFNPKLPDEQRRIEAGYLVANRHQNGDVMINFAYPSPSQPVKGGYDLHAMLWSGAELQAAYALRFRSFIGERVPPWLDHGLVKLMNLMVCTESGIEFPPITTDPTVARRARSDGAAASLQAALASGQFLTLPQLFEILKAPPAMRGYYRSFHLNGSPYNGYWSWGQMLSGTFDDEAYEFVRFCLFGAEGRHRAAFEAFARAVSNGPLDEAGFQHFFGESYQAMLQELWAYTDFAKPVVSPFSPAGLAARPPITSAGFQPAAPADLAALKSVWQQRPALP